jgi:hypothetical protein
MEAFFDTPLCYWAAAEASVKQLTTKPTWPPFVCAIGHAPCIRAWCSSGDPKAPEFSPVPSLLNLDGQGSRKSCMASHGDLLIVGDTSSEGLITVWDTTNWQHKQSFGAKAPVSSLCMNGQHVAAGTAQGFVRIWHQKADCEAEWAPSLDKELSVEPPGRPCLTICMGSAPDGTSLLVAHSAAKCRIYVWRLQDGQLLQTLGCVVEPSNAAALAVQTNVQFAFLDGR